MESSFPSPHPLFTNIATFINTITTDDFAKAYAETMLSKLSSPPLDFPFLSSLISFNILPLNASLRSLCWKAFSNYYPSSSATSFTSFFDSKRNTYYHNKQSTSLSPKITRRITEDLLRTRCSLNILQQHPPHNQTETHFQVLTRILTVFASIHSDIGYIQGMNEIVFMFYYCFILDDNTYFSHNAEADAFWCFSNYIISLRDIYTFTSNGELGVNTRLNKVAQYIQVIDPELHACLPNENNVLNMLVFKWYFVGMCQNFSIDKSMFIFDNILSEQDDRYLYLDALCVSAVKVKRDEILKCKHSMEKVITVLKVFNDDHARMIVVAVKKMMMMIREIIAKENSAFIIQ